MPKTKKELYNIYYLKEELVKICKEHNLPTSGYKEDLLQYISDFIENKPVNKITKKKKSNNNFEPAIEKIIDENYSNSEIHRTFFKKVISEKFKYNVPFCKWMYENKGVKTYQDAINTYNKILLDKKSGKKFEIGKQFKYNQYTRDFFNNNPKLSMTDCIKCWNYKKKQTGNHKYEKTDLIALEK
ncbi:MAG: SAP domain-containing protein [Bacteroidetes bacterium]|nr:SAP domain-containing protein [Bacteroidota bacterium]